MHRRARHLNATHAGALVALDSRFISGLSSGTAVDTWNNRTGTNNFTSTSTARPVFTQPSIAGNPAIVFDGVNDRMDSPSLTYNSSFILVCAARQVRTLNYTPVTIDGVCAKLDYNTTSPRTGFLTYFSNTYVTTTNTFTQVEMYSGSTEVSQTRVNGAIVSATGAVTVGTPAIVSTNKTSINTGSASAMVVGYGGTTYYGKVDVGYVAYIPGVSSDSLRRRFEQSAAYSFKIACS